MNSESIYLEEIEPETNRLLIISSFDINYSNITNITGFYEIITDDSTSDVNIPLEVYIELSQYADMHFHEHAYNAFLKHYLLAADHECETINTVSLNKNNVQTDLYTYDSDSNTYEFNNEIHDYIGPGKWFVIEGTDTIALCIGKSYEDNEITSAIQTYSLITNHPEHIFLEIQFNESIPMWELPADMFPNACTVRFCKPLTQFNTVNTSTTDVLLKYMETQDAISTSIVKTIRLLHDIPLYTHRELMLEDNESDTQTDPFEEINALKQSVQELTRDNESLKQAVPELTCKNNILQQINSEMYTFKQKYSEIQLENKLIRKEMCEIRKLLKQ